MAENIGTKIVLEGEKEYRNALKQITQEGKTLKSEMDKVSSAYDKNGSSAKGNAEKQKVLDQQSIIGAALSRLERTSTNLTTSITDDQSSESTIRDADMAKEMAGYTKYNLLTQTSQAMLAQANQNPNSVLYLLGGDNETE